MVKSKAKAEQGWTSLPAKQWLGGSWVEHPLKLLYDTWQIADPVVIAEGWLDTLDITSNWGAMQKGLDFFVTWGVLPKRGHK